MSGERHFGQFRSAWGELGIVGRLAFWGIALSGAITVGLGFLLPETVREHVLAARLSELERAVVDIGVIDADLSTVTGRDAFARTIELKLLGGDVIRVKLWSADGSILWSDEPRLVDSAFPVSRDLARAFSGIATVEPNGADEPENEFEAGLGGLIEFYLPVIGPDGSVGTVFEVYQRRGPLQETLARVRQATWLRIGFGLGFLSLFMASLALVTVRGVERRRRESDVLLQQSLRIRDEERTRLVAALHDDVGQPLYRLLYGIEALGSSHLTAQEAGAEATRLAILVREIDDTLRSEMRRLRTHPVDHLGLAEALRGLASDRVTVDVVLGEDVEPAVEEAVYRAVREAVANADKHSGAKWVKVRVRDDARQVVAEVDDDGSWLPGPPGLGLATVRRLLETVGGELRVTHPNGHGTTVQVRAPLGGPI